MGVAGLLAGHRARRRNDLDRVLIDSGYAGVFPGRLRRKGETNHGKHKHENDPGHGSRRRR